MLLKQWAKFYRKNEVDYYDEAPDSHAHYESAESG